MAVSLKICGVTSRHDAELCRAAGVNAVGLNFWSGSRRFISPRDAVDIADAARDDSRIVGVFVDASPQQVADVAKMVGLDAIQLHGDVEPTRYAALGLPWIWVIRNAADPTTLRIPEPAPDWVLLDAPTPHYGGQGLVADWGWAASVVAALAPLPVWLAGGLHPSNAQAAITAVSPAGLDIASGAEVAGTVPPVKDPAAVSALVSVCNAANCVTTSSR